MHEFPSLKANQFLRKLTSEPLNYRIIRSKGSQMILKSKGRGDIIFSWHGKVEIPGFRIRKVLIESAGLSEEQAWQVIH